MCLCSCHFGYQWLCEAESCLDHPRLKVLIRSLNVVNCTSPHELVSPGPRVWILATTGSAIVLLDENRIPSFQLPSVDRHPTPSWLRGTQTGCLRAVIAVIMSGTWNTMDATRNGRLQHCVNSTTWAQILVGSEASIGESRMELVSCMSSRKRIGPCTVLACRGLRAQRVSHVSSQPRQLQDALLMFPCLLRH
jgi:hypothetical protein